MVNFLHLNVNKTWKVDNFVWVSLSLNACDLKLSEPWGVEGALVSPKEFGGSEHSTEREVDNLCITVRAGFQITRNQALQAWF